MKDELTDTGQGLQSGAIDTFLLNLINSYADWEKVQYLQVPEPNTPADTWAMLTAVRAQQSFTNTINIAGQTFSWYVSPEMQKILHEWDRSAAIDQYLKLQYAEKDRHRVQLAAIVDEVVASLQLSGYTVTKKQARDIILKNISPRNETDQAVKNLYQAFIFLLGHTEKKISAALLKQVHAQISKDLVLPKAQGQFRTNAKVDLSTTQAGKNYKPFEAGDLAAAINDLEVFCNNTGLFRHPVVVAGLLEYLINYLKPFRDGNGRLARLISFWWMYAHGYTVTAYQPITQTLIKFKAQYTKTFSQVITNGNDAGYFVHFKLQILQWVLKSARQQLVKAPKQERKKAATPYRDLNFRQCAVVQWVKDDGQKIVTIREVRRDYGVSKETARTDLNAMVEKGWLKYYQLNKKTYAFIKGDAFDQLAVPAHT